MRRSNRENYQGGGGEVANDNSMEFHVSGICFVEWKDVACSDGWDFNWAHEVYSSRIDNSISGLRRSFGERNSSQY